MYRLGPTGAAFTAQSRAGLREYQAFRSAHKGLPRAELSRLWKIQKALERHRETELTPEEVESFLEGVAVEDPRNDPKFLLRELLKASQGSPCCFPYGLSGTELGDAPKLRAALRKANNVRCG